jgi:hypothetical protein
MNRSEPPRLATWLLEHLTTAGRNEALAGDLLEEFRAGRSSGWYWRQIISAVAIGWARSIFEHRIVLLFAAFWSLLSPAWELTFIRVFWESNFIGSVWRMPWPWSAASAIGLGIVEALLFIWIGSLLYSAVLLFSRRRLDFRRLGHGFAMSIVVFLAPAACVFVLRIVAGVSSNEAGTDWRTLTLLGETKNFQAWAILWRIPYILGTACAIWGGTRRVAKKGRVPA